MENNITLIGLGGNVIDIYEALKNKKYIIQGYVDISRNKNLEQKLDIKYLGSDKDFKKLNKKNLLITFAGVGRNIVLRKKIFELYKDYCITFLFPESTVSGFAKISSKGVLIFGNTTIKAFCEIKDNVFINTGTIIGHHTIIKNNCVISIGVMIGGNVIIEEDVFIGMGAMIFQNITIGKGSIIGAGL